LIDANVRPDFIDDPADYRDRLDRMIASADIVKVSDEDLEWLLPDSANPVADMLARGPNLVLLTKGADGAEAHSAAGTQAHVASQPVTVVDTVGAGDTFNAGVLKSLLDSNALTRDGVRSASEDVLTRALARGSDAAAITVSRAGANPPWAHELSA
jgi:fructokinase